MDGGTGVIITLGKRGQTQQSNRGCLFLGAGARVDELCSAPGTGPDLVHVP